ncbi:hypothetical protein SAMN05421803_12859 [Nocardiopsis flavescens]|uniref:Uncharacterized protein n=1 Tax=Nocardiopsis flavescens TaxID=758803 RepID=A0A1M6ULM9_9ACTN|nr:hypothetical protein SAMN05421803_12859 [Nocardiopsis flavescens]
MKRHPGSRGLTRAHSAPRTMGGEGRAYLPRPATGVVHPPGVLSHSRRASLPRQVARGEAAGTRPARRRGCQVALPHAPLQGVRRTWRSPGRSPVGNGGLWSRPTRTFGLQDGHRLERHRPAEPDPPPRHDGRQTDRRERGSHVPGGGGVLSGGGSGRGLPRPTTWKRRKGPPAHPQSLPTSLGTPTPDAVTRTQAPSRTTTGRGRACAPPSPPTARLSAMPSRWGWRLQEGEQLRGPGRGSPSPTPRGAAGRCPRPSPPRVRGGRYALPKPAGVGVAIHAHRLWPGPEDRARFTPYGVGRAWVGSTYGPLLALTTLFRGHSSHPGRLGWDRLARPSPG